MTIRSPAAWSLASPLVLSPISASGAPAADPLPGFGALIALVAIAIAASVAFHKRRHYRDESG